MVDASHEMLSLLQNIPGYAGVGKLALHDASRNELGSYVRAGGTQVGHINAQWAASTRAWRLSYPW